MITCALRPAAFAALCTFATAVAPLAAQSAADAPIVRAELAWAAGDYPRALTLLDSVLQGPDAEALRERIALLTGENWHTTLVAENARAPRWSRDGRWMSYETGVGSARVTRVAAATTDAGFVVRAELVASDVALSPSAGRVAWIEVVGETSQLRVGELPARAPRVPALTGRVITLGALRPAQVRFANDSTLLVVAAPEGDVRTALYRVALTPRGASGQPVRLTRTDSVVADPVLAGAGEIALVGVGGRSPLQRGTGGAFGRGPARRQFAVLDLRTGRETVIAGEGAVVSTEGSHVAWITRADGRQQVHVAPATAPTDARVVHATTDPLDALALSPDGTRITFQQRPREDWELYTVHVGDGRLERLTREIQHDLLPQWLDDTRLLAVMGEARHRRAHLYVNGERRRLFHNNTVRTIAPEYEWVPSPDGRKLLIVAERDGDTVTPHRHLWCVDLSREVTVSELRARLADNLRSEEALRAEGQRVFAPITEAVRAAVAEVNVDRIYRFGFDLFQFDSKHLTQPGNAKARDYLLATYRSFGYRDVHEQRFDARTGVDRPTVPTANIVAVLPGTTHPELVYVISSHFDSRAEGPGADDNSSGTQALLETARVLASRPQPATIMFASLSGEESGLLGGREFVRVAKANGLRLMGVLNNDMVGWANDQRLDNTIRYSNPGIRDIQHAAAIGFTDLITYDAFYYKSTDAQAFYDGYGDIVGGIGSYPVLGNPHYHQPHDVLETINHRLVAEVAKTTVASIMYLASAPARLAGLTLTVESGGTVRAAWTASPERDVVRYVVTWGPAEAPMQHRMETAETSLVLGDAPAGTVVRVKAVNARGLEGWDWAIARRALR